MEAAGNGTVQISGGQGEQQLMISGVGGDQPLVMSAEDAAQFLAQAGLQLADVTDSGEQIIINSESLQNAAGLVKEEDQQVTLNVGEEGEQGQQLEGLALNDFNDGTVLYIDPNDPQAAALLQQAGLTIAEDGTVTQLTDENAEQGGQQMQLVQGDPEVITAEQQDDPNDSNQLGSMMEGTDNASTEVPQDLFMNSEDLVDSKDNIVLDAAQVAAAVRQNQLELATPMTQTQQVLQQVPQLSTMTATTPAVSSVPRMTPVTASHKRVVINAPPPPVKSEIVTKSIVQAQQPRSRIVAQVPPRQVHQVHQASPPIRSPPPIQQQPPQQQQIIRPQQVQQAPAAVAPTSGAATNTITVGPDQQQVFYTVSGEDGKTQQYMMLCPKDMDQNTLITTLVRQISADPTNKGKKTIRITQHKSAPGAAGGANPIDQAPSAPAVRQVVRQQPRGGGGGGGGGSPRVTATPKTIRQTTPTVTARSQQQQNINNRIGEILSATSASEPPAGLNRDLNNIVDSSETFESVLPHQNIQEAATQAAQTAAAAEQQAVQQQVQQAVAQAAAVAGNGNTEDVRVYVRCNYCDTFRSTLNSDTWEAILNHILPVAKEEIQTTFYGDLEKHFHRSVRIQVNGRQMVRTRTPSGSSEINIPQVEVILTHSLVCRKTRREFIVSSDPDASFVANLAKHIRQMQPGTQMAKANSLLCIFCNSPYTYEDYLRHIQPSMDTILATLCCFSGAYCASTYENNVRATKACQGCQEPEPADLRFLPCTRFSAEYQCLSKLQFAIECFRENCGDNGFMRLNTSTLAGCTVCKNPQQVYCTLFHITSTILNEADETTRDVDTQLSVCVNCQKQFINIVMKEQNFDDRLKQFQLRNMEQLCSCLRVILGQAKSISEGRKTLIYTVQETSSTSPSPSAVHTVRMAEITEINPITRLIALAESDVLGSNVKAFFMCDLCMFTIDLTSILVTPGAAQKNEMLLSIVLEHLVPHTESLLSVIADTAGSKTFNFKMEIKAKVTTTGHQRKIVLSLQKKFVSSSSGLEIALEKDEERTLNQLRASVRADRQRSFVNIRTKSDGGTTIMTAQPSSQSSQLVDVNKFIDKQKGKLSTLAQCGCNTHLLSAYTECRLCSKFCFPDFRLSGASKKIDLCENCVETVLTLCLPSDPEVLEVGEECLALKEEKVVGHRLVLANNVKKWLSLDGVNLIKKTVEEFNSSSNSVFSRLSDCGPIFSEALKQHLLANLKTCYSDEDIATAVTGFSVTEDFFRNSKYTGRDAGTAAALASLQEQVDLPIREADSTNRNIIIRRKIPERQIEVKILERRPQMGKKNTIPIRIGPPLRGTPRGRGGGLVSGNVSNGGGSMIIERGMIGGSNRALVISPSGSVTQKTTPGRVVSASNIIGAVEDTEESVSAIQSFINETSTTVQAQVVQKTPSPSVRITSTASGVVNIKAVSDVVPQTVQAQVQAQVIRQIPTTTPRGRGRPPKIQAQMQAHAVTSTPISADAVVGSVRNMKGVSMVTLTAGGIIKEVTPHVVSAKRKRPDLDSDDEGDSDDLYDEDDLEDDLGVDPAGNPPNGAKKGDGDYRPPRKVGDPDSSGGQGDDSMNSSDNPLNSSKRQRKEKKIFDL